MSDIFKKIDTFSGFCDVYQFVYLTSEEDYLNNRLLPQRINNRRIYPENIPVTTKK
ncbi:hypothetical protein SAMN04487995_2597 [Dyadobacter koreensis]|uniref:Uncharacterized protein n=1 Tax=Dyadobacter koreensis TaxID=408657 RepID=A0A1H6UKZ6_9BACT|nr:hypothetical protein SAMN04487995_2597 [Dyadobacter koreensis]